MTITVVSFFSIDFTQDIVNLLIILTERVSRDGDKARVYKKRHGLFDTPSKMFLGLGSGVTQFYCDKNKTCQYFD